MPTYPLTRSADPLVADVDVRDTTRQALAPFDLDPDAVTKFYPWEMPEEMPLITDFGIGLIVGASGSGKSQLLSRFGATLSPSWEPRLALAEHFRDAEEATERFYAVGLNTVPVWRLPYDVLSNGQKFRADLARVIGDGAVVDEFTSVVDRNVAASASKALRTYLSRSGIRGMVLASCHRDVIPWLRPDWVIDTDAGTFTVGEVEEAPRWYAEHLTGPAVGRLTLAAAPVETAPVPEPETPLAPADAEEPEEPTDEILRLIAREQTYSGLQALYHVYRARWTPAHTESAKARRAEIERTS